MKDLNLYTKQEIIDLVKENKITIADFTDSGICPTCFNEENNSILYGDIKSRMIYEDKNIECVLVANPRAEGHVVISTKKHYKDMLELDDVRFKGCI